MRMISIFLLVALITGCSANATPKTPKDSSSSKYTQTEPAGETQTQNPEADKEDDSEDLSNMCDNL